MQRSCSVGAHVSPELCSRALRHTIAGGKRAGFEPSADTDKIHSWNGDSLLFVLKYGRDFSYLNFVK